MHVAGADTKDGSGARLVGEAHAETPRGGDVVETLVQNMDMDGLNCHKMGTLTGYLGVLRSITVVKAPRPAAAAIVRAPPPPRRAASPFRPTRCANLQPLLARAPSCSRRTRAVSTSSTIPGRWRPREVQSSREDVIYRSRWCCHNQSSERVMVHEPPFTSFRSYPSSIVLLVEFP